MSVLDQTYSNIELIIVDDASNDNSRDTILTIRDQEFTTIFLETNVGNCKAFNTGFSRSKGDYIIDLAADDVLEPDRVALGVSAFTGEDIGVHHGNMMMIREDGSEIGLYHPPDENIPQGWIYAELLSRHFIGGPSTMVKRKVLEDMGGYDEHLAYEDFDFWVTEPQMDHVYPKPHISGTTQQIKKRKNTPALSFFLQSCTKNIKKGCPIP